MGEMRLQMSEGKCLLSLLCVGWPSTILYYSISIMESHVYSRSILLNPQSALQPEQERTSLGLHLQEWHSPASPTANQSSTLTLVLSPPPPPPPIVSMSALCVMMPITHWPCAPCLVSKVIPHTLVVLSAARSHSENSGIDRVYGLLFGVIIEMN
jgi:hypothetical protein